MLDTLLLALLTRRPLTDAEHRALVLLLAQLRYASGPSPSACGVAYGTRGSSTSQNGQ